MNFRSVARGVAVIALALLAPAGRAAHAEVIVDDSFTDATPDEALAGLSGCASIPGCTAIWHEGAPAVLILQYVPADAEVVTPGAPPSELDERPGEPNPPSTDVDDSIPDPGGP